MNTRQYLLLMVSLTGFWTSGCSAVSKSIQPALLQTSSFAICPWKSSDSGLEIVRDTASWQQLLAQPQQNLEELRKWEPRFNNSQRVIIYRMGQKNSAGFSASFGAPSLLPGDQLRLPVALITPAAGSMNAMVLTSPCVVGLVQVSSGTAVELVNNSTKAVIATARL